MIKNDLQNKLNTSNQKSKTAETVDVLHTHTCSFIGKISTIFALKNNINFKRQNIFNILSLFCVF